MSDLDPAAVMAAHDRHPYGSCTVTVLREMQSEQNHCEPYRLAEALMDRVDDYAQRTRELVEAHEALVAEQAKVARVESFAQTHAISAHALGRGDDERGWLDLLIVLERLAVAYQPEHS